MPPVAKITVTGTYLDISDDPLEPAVQLSAEVQVPADRMVVVADRNTVYGSVVSIPSSPYGVASLELVFKAGVTYRVTFGSAVGHLKCDDWAAGAVVPFTAIKDLPGGDGIADPLTWDAVISGLNGRIADQVPPAVASAVPAYLAAHPDLIEDAATAAGTTAGTAAGALAAAGKVDKAALGLSVKDYGAKGDGVTDDTPAFEAWLAALNNASERANGLGGKGARGFIPPGNYSIPNGLATRIVKDGVFIQGAASGTSIITGGAGTIFAWGTGTGIGYPKGGGVSDLKFRYVTPDATACIFDVDFAGELEFRNIKLAGVGKVLNAGYSSTRYANGLRFHNIRGTAFNLGVPLFDLRYGAGFYLQGSDIVGDGVTYPTDATSTHGAAPGRAFVAATTGSWDTISLNQVLCNRFYDGLQIEAAAGASVVNIHLTDVWLDYCARGAIRCISNGGNITKLAAANAYVVATDGHGVEIACPGGGLVHGFNFVNVESVFCGKNAFRATGNAKHVGLLNCTSFGSNRLAGSNTGDSQDSVVMSCSNWRIIGGRHGGDGQPYNGFVNQARYGLTVAANSDRYVLTGALLEGATGATQLISHTTTSADRQVGHNFSGTGAPLSYATTGSVAAPASDTDEVNRSGMTWTLYGRGGAVTAVKVAGTVVANSSPFMVRVRPGDAWQMTYTSAPTVVRQVEQ